MRGPLRVFVSAEFLRDPLVVRVIEGLRRRRAEVETSLDLELDPDPRFGGWHGGGGRALVERCDAIAAIDAGPDARCFQSSFIGTELLGAVGAWRAGGAPRPIWVRRPGNVHGFPLGYRSFQEAATELVADGRDLANAILGLALFNRQRLAGMGPPGSAEAIIARLEQRPLDGDGLMSLGIRVRRDMGSSFTARPDLEVIRWLGDASTDQLDAACCFLFGCYRFDLPDDVEAALDLLIAARSLVAAGAATDARYSYILLLDVVLSQASLPEVVRPRLRAELVREGATPFGDVRDGLTKKLLERHARG